MGLVGLSSLLLLLRSFSQKHRLEEAARPSLPYEICSQLARATTFGFASVSATHEPSDWPIPLLFGYIFVLGILGLVHRKAPRQELLRHVNIIQVAALAQLLLSDAIPLVLLEITSELQFNPLRIALLVALASCNLISLFTPQEWISPSISWDLIQRPPEQTPSPEETCSYFSYYLSYGWLTSLVWKGIRQNLTIDDLPPLPYYDEPLLWLPRILDARRRGVGTTWTLVILLRKELLMMALLSVIIACLEFIAPFAMYRLLGYIARPESAMIDPSVWVCLLFLGPNLRGIAYQHSVFIITRLSVRLKLSLI